MSQRCIYLSFLSKEEAWNTKLPNAWHLYSIDWPKHCFRCPSNTQHHRLEYTEKAQEVRPEQSEVVPLFGLFSDSPKSYTTYTKRPWWKIAMATSSPYLVVYFWCKHGLIFFAFSNPYLDRYVKNAAFIDNKFTYKAKVLEQLSKVKLGIMYSR